MRQCSEGVFSTNLTNSSTATEARGVVPHAYVTYVLITISSLLCLFGFVGNIIVAVVIRTVKTMQTTTNWLVFNLTIADLFIVLITIPYNLIHPHISWPFGDLSCKYLLMPTMEHFASVCVLTHTAISLARYANIRHPQETVTHNHVRVTIFFIWVISFLVLSATLMGFLGEFVLRRGREKQLMCVLCWKSALKQKMYRVLVFTLTHLIPLVATAFAYYKIHLIVRSSLKNVHTLLTHSARMHRQRESRHLDTTLMIMFIMFTVITSPLQIFMFLHEFHLVHAGPHTSLCVFNILLTLFYAQTLSNPIVLLYKGKQYRNAMKRFSIRICFFFRDKDLRTRIHSYRHVTGESRVPRTETSDTVRSSSYKRTVVRATISSRGKGEEQTSETAPEIGATANIPVDDSKGGSVVGDMKQELMISSTITIELSVSDRTVLSQNIRTELFKGEGYGKREQSMILRESVL